jgi:N-acetylmuramoyl-L-alanine amidase
MDPIFRSSAWLSRISAVAFSLLLPTGLAHAAPATPWDTAKIEGRDYVSIESLKRAYQFTDLTRSGNSLVLERKLKDTKTGKLRTTLQMKLNIGGNECLMNGVKFVLSENIATSGDKPYVSTLDLAKLIDPVLRPTYIRNAGDFRTVVLDPGHGGKDPGATNSFGTEASYNMKVAGVVKSLLEKDGFKVVMTRESDQFLSLQERVTIANSVNGDAIFVSIHFNSGGREARGIETFTLSPPGVSHYGRSFRSDDNQSRTGNTHDSANIALATAVHGTILTELRKDPNPTNPKPIDRGIKRARFSVLSGVRHPAILLEGGFMSHPYEARLIDNANYQKTLGVGVYKAILKYRKAVTQGPPATPN